MTYHLVLYLLSVAWWMPSQGQSDQKEIQWKTKLYDVTGIVPDLMSPGSLVVFVRGDIHQVEIDAPDSLVMVGRNEVGVRFVHGKLCVTHFVEVHRRVNELLRWLRHADGALPVIRTPLTDRLRWRLASSVTGSRGGITVDAPAPISHICLRTNPNLGWTCDGNLDGPHESKKLTDSREVKASERFGQILARYDPHLQVRLGPMTYDMERVVTRVYNPEGPADFLLPKVMGILKRGDSPERRVAVSLGKWLIVVTTPSQHLLVALLAEGYAQKSQPRNANKSSPPNGG